MVLVNQYLPVILDAFVAKTKHEYLDDDGVLNLLTLFVVENLAYLKMNIAVDALLALLKSLNGNPQPSK
jgi:hypothetical protein